MNQLFIIQTQSHTRDYQPRMFPPGEPRIPVKLRTPDQPLDDCPVSCADLKLEYNPNKEGPGTIFECDTPIIFGESNTAAWPDSRLMEPVKIATTNRCHLFCDRVSNNSYHIPALIAYWYSRCWSPSLSAREMESGQADLTWATGATLSQQVLHLQVTHNFSLVW